MPGGGGNGGWANAIAEINRKLNLRVRIVMWLFWMARVKQLCAEMAAM
jgi:hypothetical protein